MKRLFGLFISPPRTKPVFAEEESLARAMQIAEIKWLLSEIAAPPSTAAN
jgi:hypothetical protein